MNSLAYTLPGRGGSTEFDINKFSTPFDYNTQKQENENLISGYQGAISGQETMPQLYSRYENQYNIPQLREAFTTGRESYQDMVNQVNSMSENVESSSRESLMTSGQKANLVAAKQAPLQKNAASLGQTLSQISTVLSENEKNLNTAMQYEIAQQKKELLPWEWKYNMQTIMQARQFTGWTTENQMELNRLIANQNAGITLSEGEKDRMAALARVEKQYELELRNAEKMAEFNLEDW